jgi:hypothetical protein
MSRQPKRCANSPSESRKIPSDLGKRGTIRVTTYDPSMRVTPAETFLRGLLADGTEHLSEAIRAEAEARGLTWRSVERARAKIPQLAGYQRGFRGRWVMLLPQPKPQSRGTATWPTYVAVTCNTCGRTAGMYHQPDNTTCHACAHCHNPTQTASHHIA